MELAAGEDGHRVKLIGIGSRQEDAVPSASTSLSQAPSGSSLPQNRLQSRGEVCRAPDPASQSRVGWELRHNSFGNPPSKQPVTWSYRSTCWVINEQIVKFLGVPDYTLPGCRAEAGKTGACVLQGGRPRLPHHPLLDVSGPLCVVGPPFRAGLQACVQLQRFKEQIYNPFHHAV